MSNKPSPSNLLALEIEKANAEIQKINAALKAKQETLILAVKKEIAEKLGEVLAIFQTLPVEIKKDVFTEPAYEMVLDSLGLAIKTEEKKKGKPAHEKRAELTRDAVKNFIGEESKTKSEICKHFAGGNAKVIDFIKAMEKEKLLISFTHKGRGKPATAYKIK